MPTAPAGAVFDGGGLTLAGMMPTAPVDPCRCPVCGSANACAMAASPPSAEPCWCTRVQLSQQLLQKVPLAARDKACICQACVQADQARA